ncbi:hypothetical protein IAD21_03109 [Abditibacteriota bacterium]|nr:hypothetical protein IAD21_03109 [Abditibacteriota bacterium]
MTNSQHNSYLTIWKYLSSRANLPLSILLVFLLGFVGLLESSAFGVGENLKTIWQIGEADHNNAEFALVPGGYNQFSEDGFFAVGRSDSHRDWPFIHPGPDDGWAGSRTHDFHTVFSLQQVPKANCRLIIRLLDTHASSPPRIRATFNNTSQEIQLPPGGGDTTLTGRFEGSKPFVWSIPIPAKEVRAGINRITISSLSGSWALYDSISFEAPPQTEVALATPVQVVAVETPPFLVRNQKTDALQQPLTVRVQNFGPATTAKLRMNGESQVVPVTAGLSKINFLTPETRKTKQTHLSLEVDGKSASDVPVTLRPIKHWTVYLLPHSHVDIGYTQLQEEVRRKQIANLQEALELIKSSKNYPTDAQFKWNIEVLWPIQDYLRDATPAQRQEFFDAVRSGKLILNAYYGNLLTGLCSSEELLRAMTPSLRVAKEAGVPLNAAMQDDTPGYTWGNVTALSQAGIKYFSPGPNNFDRMGSTLIRWHDKPFYWVSPSGKSKVLFWMPYGGYALGTVLSSNLPPFIPGYLNELEGANYPYDITYLRWCVNGDNGSPDKALSDTVRDWNATHAYPHLVIAATSEPFVALEKRYGKKIPSYRGDFTPYWEDGAASTARETVLKRNATDRLVQTQALWAMQGRPNFPVASFRSAWENALLYSEHTWGAYNSTSEPDLPFVKSQWDYKQAFALRADEQSRSLLASTETGAATNQVDVSNTESWTRTDLALIPAEQSKIGDKVLDAMGQTVPSQRLSDGQLAILVRDIPPFSTRRYSLVAGKSTPQGSASVNGNHLRNSTVSVDINPLTGAISQLHVAGLPGNLVDTKSPTAVNDYFYLPGGDLKDLVRNGSPTITVEDSGPLVVTLRIESDAPGTRHLVRRVRLISGIKRVDLSDTIDKTPIRAYEGIHIGFGFNVPNPVMHMDMPLAVVRPEQDQLPAANRNWYPVQHWIDVSNNSHGITWATQDAPLIEIGGITANLPGLVPQNDPRWIKHIASSATFYSWAMNNHWHTNYKADQEGPVTFRYSLAPHGLFAPDEAARFGQGISRPLLAVPASGTLQTKPLLQVSSPQITVAELKPSDDGKAWIVRLWGASGRDQTVRLTWQGRPVTSANLSDTAENSGPKIGPNFSVPGYDVATLRITHN